MTQSQPPSDAIEARALHRFAVLRELADIGMEIARAVGRQAAQAAAEAEAAAPGEPAAASTDFALQFQRIARTVRQTLALEAKFDDERRARREKAEAERAVEARLRGIRRKIQVGDIVEQILDEAPASDAERLSDSLHERLEDADDREFADAPLGEIVAGICRDLRVIVDWSIWEDEPWAAEALAAERPFLSREAGEGDRPPPGSDEGSARGQAPSGGWRGQASSAESDTS